GRAALCFLSPDSGSVLDRPSFPTRRSSDLPQSLRFGPQDWEALARRFLKSLDSDVERRWIERLALTPRFDEAAARAAFSSEHSRSEEHTSELQSREKLVCRLLLAKRTRRES